MEQQIAELKALVEAYKSTPQAQAPGAFDPAGIVDIIVNIAVMLLSAKNPALAAIIAKVGEIIKGFFSA